MRQDPKTQNTILEIATGKIMGRIKDGIYSFKGIPFGETPTGKKRWRRAMPPTSWTGIKETFTTVTVHHK